MSTLAPHLTVREVAAELSVSERTVRRAIDSGELPSVRLGARVVRVPSTAIAQLATTPKEGNTHEHR